MMGQAVSSAIPLPRPIAAPPPTLIRQSAPMSRACVRLAIASSIGTWETAVASNPAQHSPSIA